ncbi:serine hydrolase [Actinacidiphila epipremni]|uniref:D-alanyl-D-alanine carboxypeptidase n=1 Tax=Actinacidiphila epipremni TaxID=2053013 RepID=A0ABX0ZST7_9ACTN|nr:serine hydrolase [Actinacidiphila epipremni]NJP46975.1 D-alanyl-D-alanine carboxypeptidase [Actinacidiphila epipremni]
MAQTGARTAGNRAGESAEGAEGAEGSGGSGAASEGEPPAEEPADAPPGTDTGPEGEHEADAGPEDGAGAVSAAGSRNGAKGKPGAQDKPGTKGKPVTKAESGDKGEPVTKAESGTKDKPGAKDEPRAAAGGKAASAPASEVEDSGVHRAEIRKSLLRPLVSDLPAERPDAAAPGRPVGRTGTPAAGATPGWAAPLPPLAAPDGPDAQGAEVADDPFGPEGTRRIQAPQVLPPGSGHTGSTPLKLLAELTNTPPPRPTLLRGILRRFKIWTPLVVLLAVIFVIVQAVRPVPTPTLKSTAASSYSFPGTPLPQTMPWPTQGQSVAEVEGVGSLGVHGAQTPVPIASVTKVMTAYVVLKDHPLTGKQNGPIITVDKQAADESASTDESTAHVTQGQQFSERQMLQLLLVPSGNNIARLLARWDAGTQEAFVAKMTATARTLGMTQTTYTGASGFEETTVSTAVDQLKLARAVMQNEVFRSVVALANVDIPGVGRIYNNNNDLVKPGVIGIKTGSSTPAGGALMWAARKNVGGKDQLILGVVLQQRGGVTVNDSLQTALDRAQQLIESVQHGLTSATVVKKGTVVGAIDDGLGGSTPVIAAADLTTPGWPGLHTPLTLTPSHDLPHSAKAGTQVGTLSLGPTTIPVTLQSDLKSPSFTAKLTHF